MMQVATMARRGRPKRMIEERLIPTPETLAKLEPDPLMTLLAMHGRGDNSLERAALEIRAVYGAVCRAVMRRGKTVMERTSGGVVEMPEALAQAHARRYIPWAAANHPVIVDATLRLVWDRDDVPGHLHERVALALRDYAKRMHGH